VFWLVAYVVSTFLAFPHPLPFAEGVVLDLGLGVGWAVPACLILGLERASGARAVRRAFFATLVGHGLVFHFIYVVTVSYGNAPVFVGALAPFLMAIYPALLGAAFAAGWSWLGARGGQGPWLAALLWTSLDYLRSMAFTGWPWATLGYSQHLNPGLLGIAPWTGVYGLSFVVALGGAALADLGRARQRREPPRRATVMALVAVVLLHGVGLASRGLPDPGGEMAAGVVRVAAIQGNIDQGVKWSPGWSEQTLVIYEDLSRHAAALGAQVIVWPETAVPGALEADASLLQRVRSLAADTGAALVVGSVGVEIDPGSGRIERFFDSAFLVEGDRGITARYDKSHLVPFGEYVPLRGLLGGLLGAVASGIASGDVTAGEQPRALGLRLGDPPRDLEASGPLGPAGELVKVGIPICYELLFPDLVRRFARDGAGMLLAITNDAWYGRTGAPYQFLAITALRSAESGVWTVRAANTGVSAIIDSEGRVRDRSPIFERSILVADVPLRSTAERATFYVRHGDVFARACCLALLAGIVAIGSRRWRGPARIDSGGQS
jgi:apolipoprotein N-acyltransferase